MLAGGGFLPHSNNNNNHQCHLHVGGWQADVLFHGILPAVGKVGYKHSPAHTWRNCTVPVVCLPLTVRGTAVHCLRFVDGDRLREVKQLASAHILTQAI